MSERHTIHTDDSLLSVTNPQQSHQTSPPTRSSSNPNSATSFIWPMNSQRKRGWHQSVSKTPRIVLRFVRAMQIFCSILVLAAGIFPVVKFGVHEQISPPLGAKPVVDPKGDWRPLLLIVIATLSLVAFPFLAIFRRRRISVVIEVVLLGLWCSFMTIYVPRITAIFEPGCQHPKPPFQYLQTHVKETSGVGIDIGRHNITEEILNPYREEFEKINGDIHTYCAMAQVGMCAGLIVILFTFSSIMLLLLLSYQATDYMIERRALELLHHHSLPLVVQQGLEPISNAYQTISNSISPVLRAQRLRLLDEENRPVGTQDVEQADEEKSNGSIQGTTLVSPTTVEARGDGQSNDGDQPTRPQQLAGWVTGGYQVR